MQQRDFPYKNIGQRLKAWRERVHETVAEVSGAVEIDVDDLRKIEVGEQLPSEDILLLLISHLDVQESEAKHIFEQAGYARSLHDKPSADDQLIKQMLMIVPFDNRILYSDSVNISANQNGVVMSFMQNNGNNQPAQVARIGTSLDHAKKMHQLLGDIIKNTGAAQRQLPTPNEKDQNPDKPATT